MAEISQPWDGTAVGDATRAPYSADEWDDMFEALFNSGATPHENFGVCAGYLNELEVTGAVTPVTVDTGAALVHGKWYLNDSALTIAVPVPAGATRYDYVALRSIWPPAAGAQTIRAVLIQGVEGAGVPPPLTQNDGVQWEIPLAILSTTIGGVITVVDDRHWLQTQHVEVVNLPLHGFTDVYASSGFYYTQENIVATFDGAHDGHIGWVIDPRNWDEEGDIVLRFGTLNAPLGGMVDGGNSRWSLYASQIGEDCIDPDVVGYRSAVILQDTVSGDPNWHVADLEFSLTYAAGFRRIYGGISITLERNGGDPLDTSAVDWRVFRARALIPT